MPWEPPVIMTIYNHSTSISSHPGLIATNLKWNIFWKLTRPSTSKWFFREKRPMMSAAKTARKTPRSTVAHKTPRPAIGGGGERIYGMRLEGSELGGWWSEG
jgi:hypothetical protein